MRFFTTKKVATKLGIDRKEVYLRLRRGKMKCMRMSEAALTRYLGEPSDP